MQLVSLNVLPVISLVNSVMNSLNVLPVISLVNSIVKNAIG